LAADRNRQLRGDASMQNVGHSGLAGF
jgi:hypothetical protein